MIISERYIMNIDRSRYKTVAEGCTILGISDVTLRKLRKLANSDDIKHGKSVLFDIEAVKEWLANNRLDVSDNEVPGRYQASEPAAKTVYAEPQNQSQPQGEVNQNLAVLSGAQQQQLISQAEIIVHQKETIQLLKDQHEKHIESLEKIQIKTLEGKNRRGALAIMVSLISISLCFAFGVYIVKERESKRYVEKKLEETQKNAESEKKQYDTKITQIEADLNDAKAKSDNLAGQYQAKYFELNDKLLQFQQELSQIQMKAKEVEAENLLLVQQLQEKETQVVEPNQAQ